MISNKRFLKVRQEEPQLTKEVQGEKLDLINLSAPFLRNINKLGQNTSVPAPVAGNKYNDLFLSQAQRDGNALLLWFRS